jgi:transposase-like protein
LTDDNKQISVAMAALGRRSSAKKAVAVRENGKKGGRPKAVPCPQCGRTLRRYQYKTLTEKVVEYECKKCDEFFEIEDKEE